MFNAREITRNNYRTFYDYESRKHRSQWPRLLMFAAVAALGAVIFPKVSDNLLAGFLAVQSILLGFTVNVMFFLLNNRERNPISYSSMESELRAERLKTLYEELFYNVSYFNMLAVASIIVAALLLLPVPVIPPFAASISYVQHYSDWLASSNVPTVISMLAQALAMFVFYALALEVTYSIARIIGRTSFYFERKMLAIGDSDASAEKHD